MGLTMKEAAESLASVAKDVAGAGRVETPTVRKRPPTATVDVKPTRSAKLTIRIEARFELREPDIDLRAIEIRDRRPIETLAVKEVSDPDDPGIFEVRVEQFLRDEVDLITRLKERDVMQPDQVAKKILETDKSAKEVAREAVEEQARPVDIKNLQDDAMAVVEEALKSLQSELRSGSIVDGVAEVSGVFGVGTTTPTEPGLQFDTETNPDLGKQEPGEFRVEFGTINVARSGDGELFAMDVDVNLVPENTAAQSLSNLPSRGASKEIRLTENNRANFVIEIIDFIKDNVAGVN